MDISSRLEFAATPKAVYLMMTDPAWLEDLISRSEATSHTVSVAGSTTRIEMALPAPKEVSRFAGNALKLVQTVEWADPAADDSRDGTLTVDSPGLPVDMHGQARMYPGGKGTIVDYSGALKVNIPLMGKKVEQMASPYIKDAIDSQQEAGDEWLASRA